MTERRVLPGSDSKKRRRKLIIAGVGVAAIGILYLRSRSRSSSRSTDPARFGPPAAPPYASKRPIAAPVAQPDALTRPMATPAAQPASPGEPARAGPDDSHELAGEALLQRQQAASTAAPLPVPGSPSPEPAPAAPGSPVAGPDTYDRSELSQVAVTGARSFAISRVVIEVLLFLSIIPIARLVAPAQVGHAAIALVFPALASILTFEGTGTPLVQRKEVTRAHLRTAMTMSLAGGLAMGVLLAVAAATAGRSLFGSETANLVIVTAPCFLISATTCVSRAMMMRRLDFRRMSRNDGWLAVGTTISTVTFAFLGLQALALVLGAIVTALLDMAFQLSYAHPVLPGWDRSAARDLRRFGVYASLNGLGWTVLRNIDYLIIGARLSPRQVGIYYRAFQFGAQYQSKVTVVLLKMLFPLMSRAKQAKDMRLVRERAVQFNALTALPLLGLLVVLAPTVVPLLYGPRWHAAIAPTQILTFAGMASVLMAGADGPALALGRAADVSRFILGFIVLYAGAILIASQYGLLAVCWAAAGVHVVMLAQRYLIDRVIGLPFKQIAIDAGPAVLATAVSMLAVAVLRSGVGDLPPILNAAVCGVVGISVYASVIRLAFPRQARVMFGLAVRVLRSQQGA
jgi:PST family polysaccharide transporter